MVARRTRPSLVCLLLTLAACTAGEQANVPAGQRDAGSLSDSGNDALDGGPSRVADGGANGLQDAEPLQDAQQGGDDGGDEGGFDAAVDEPHWPEVAVRDASEIVHVRWKHRAPGAVYSLDIKSGDTWIGPCVNAELLGARLSWDFDGRCPSAQNQDFRSIESVRICSSLPTPPSAWDSATSRCTAQDYKGGAVVEIDSEEDLTNTVVLRWPSVPDARYALHLELANGTFVDNCASADLLGRRTSFAFTGHCPSQPNLGSIELTSVTQYVVDYAGGGHWTEPRARGRGELPADGRPGDYTLTFANYRNWFTSERCGLNPAADYRFDSGVTLTAQACTNSEEPRFLKRRLPVRDQYQAALYPRSFRDDDGTVYVLFATPPGGFSPAQTSGCPELNLLVTRNWVDYEVTQIDRLCGYSRLDNGELAVIDGKLYVIYHTITGNNGCTAPGNVPGREWMFRLKVSENYRDTDRVFTDLAGTPNSYDALKVMCLPNASQDGHWEPMIYKAGDGSLRVAYTDDTPPEVADGKCNQYIRVLEYSPTDRRELSDEPVGDCPGDKRDGMPVVVRDGNGRYAMVIESLGAPSAQIVMFSSDDGVHFGPRQVVADVAVDGGLMVGCPYIAFDGTQPYISYYHTYNSESGAKLGAYRVRALGAQGERRADRLFELRRRWEDRDELDILYWGGVRLNEGRLYAVSASWSHPFSEAWMPLFAD